MNSHLSSEQLERVLAGRPSHEVSQHLGKCARCVEDVASMRAVLGNFRSAASSSAEHHLKFAAPVATARVPRTAWVLASVVLFAGIATPFAVRRQPVSPVVVGVSTQALPAISDEALLNNVQNDLSASVPESLLPLADTSTNAVNSTDEKRKN
jgi:anti-sigma factor RsiW